jgi:eukaryotic-like serine/threonine-protein kinase
LGIISLELFLGVHPFDPTYLENHFSIVENILQNKFLVETKDVKADPRMVELAGKTLRQQPFERFRNYQLFNAFLEKNISK